MSKSRFADFEAAHFLARPVSAVDLDALETLWTPILEPRDLSAQGIILGLIDSCRTYLRERDEARMHAQGAEQNEGYMRADLQEAEAERDRLRDLVVRVVEALHTILREAEEIAGK